MRDGRGRTAYAVATSKETRDAFRRHMGLAPAQWDWHAAGVPSALTGELEAAQAAKRVSSSSLCCFSFQIPLEKLGSFSSEL